MPIRDTSEKVLAFRSARPAPSHPLDSQRHSVQTRSKLHPVARRRRLLWLAIMVCLIGWSLVQLVIQQFRIWDKEAELAKQQTELVAVQGETKSLHDVITKLHDPAYLNELAHKMGYAKPNEELYTVGDQ